ncbi:hypothetical protein DL89DRAFT_259995 [Linderina pennispora]|uniref:F-box domain-containing protein n=1 Tax=Linderina pennispora TaxID=61395 RepID=A0A1Y1W057_9FUNG|nr:uncharacterized protein DL89DRAFT_259995 [Linderina pennispora]ORX66893.1 hypothetical protein DL89DRAFT_259995 [Linderina pennispora]
MPSLAQNLPNLILCRIFEHSVDTFLYIRTLQLEMANYKIMWPFMHLCRSWREASVDLLLSHAIMTMNRKSRIHLAIALGAYEKVRDVCLLLDTSDVFDGAVLAKLRQAPLTGSVFPHVSRLHLSLLGPLPSGRPSIALLEGNAIEFCGEIQRMFPAATYTSINHSPSNRDNVFPAFAKELMSRLLAGKTGVRTNGVPLTTNPCLLSTPCCLQSIETVMRRESPEFIGVINRSWQTLQQIHLIVPSSSTIKQIVVDSQGTVVTYPCLRDLTLSISIGETRLPASELASPDGVPFPVLERLVLHSQYPFANDILFRNNGQSLKHLDIELTEDTFATFERCGVFDNRRLVNSRVQHVFRAFVHVPVIEINHCSNVSFDSIEPHLGGLSKTVRVLNIASTHLTTEQILRLIESLSFLQTMCVTLIESAVLEDDADYAQNGDRNDRPLWHACEGISAAGVRLVSGPATSQRLLYAGIHQQLNVRLHISFRLQVILMLRCPSIRRFDFVLGECTSVDSSLITSDVAFVELAARIGVGAGGW